MRSEIKYYEDISIDIDKLMIQSREADKIRGQMAVLERRVQVNNILSNCFEIIFNCHCIPII